MSKRNPRKRPSAAEMNRRRAQIEEAEALKATSPTVTPSTAKRLIVKGEIKWDSLNSPAGLPTFRPPPYSHFLDLMIRQSLFLYPFRTESESPSPLKLPRRHIDTPIVGYRSWKLTMESDDKATLRATAVSVPWEGTTATLRATAVSVPWEGTTIRARCVEDTLGIYSPPPKRHASPSPSCRCGIYAYTHPRPALATADQVHGAIVAWGRVVEHGAEGFRAANAQIIALGLRPESMFASYHDWWKADQLTREGARRLKVPVVAVEALELYAREFGEHLA